MSTITNQITNKNSEQNGSKQNNGNGKFSNTKFQRLKKDRTDMKCWGVGVWDMVGENVQHPDKVTISLSDWPTII